MASLLPTRILALLYAPALLLLYVANSGLLSRAGCVVHGVCQLLGAPISFSVSVPQIGDVLLAGVLLCMTWLVAVVVLVKRWRHAAEPHLVVVVAAHGLLLYGGVRTYFALVAKIQALSVTNVLASRCPSEYDMRNGWRAFDAGLGGSVGAVPVRPFAEGLAKYRAKR